MNGIPLPAGATSPKPNQTAGPVQPTPTQQTLTWPTKPDQTAGPVQPMPVQTMRDADQGYEAPEGAA